MCLVQCTHVVDMSQMYSFPSSCTTVCTMLLYIGMHAPCMYKYISIYVYVHSFAYLHAHYHSGHR